MTGDRGGCTQQHDARNHDADNGQGLDQGHRENDSQQQFRLRRESIEPMCEVHA